MKKELKIEKDKVTELQTKVEILTTEKAKAEAEVARITTQYKFLEEAMEKTKESNTPNKVDSKCRDFEKGFCSWKERCRFQHPKELCQEHANTGSCSKVRCRELHKEKQGDCVFWMRGDCRHPGGSCRRGNHDQAKYNTRPKQMSQDEKIAEAVQKAVKNLQFTSHPAGSYHAGSQPSIGVQQQTQQMMIQQPGFKQHTQQQAGQPVAGQQMQQQPAYGQQQFLQQPSSGQNCQNYQPAFRQQVQHQTVGFQGSQPQQSAGGQPVSQQEQNNGQVIEEQSANGQQGLQQQPANGQPGSLQKPTNGLLEFQQQPANGQPGCLQQPANGQPGFQQLPANGQPGFQQQPANGQTGFQQQPTNGQQVSWQQQPIKQLSYQTVGLAVQQPQYEYGQQGWAHTAGQCLTEQMEMGGLGGPPAPFRQ